MFRLVVLVIAAASASPSLATLQAGDWLLYEGVRLYVEIESAVPEGDGFDASPLEWYFKRGHARPGFEWSDTSLGRGYQATWLVEDGRLFLVGIEGTANGRPVTLGDIDPAWRERVFAAWFTGVLVGRETGPGSSRIRLRIRAGEVVTVGFVESPRTAGDGDGETR